MNEKAIKSVNKYKENKEKYLKSLIEFLKIETISSISQYKDQMYLGADWVAGYLNSLGASETKILKTQKYPVVYGLIRSSYSEAPTILIYGHYDVQSPDPLNLWESDPFSPEIRDGNLYARGASDMKGQLMVVLNAIRAIQETDELPINFKFIIEGEEEIGSPCIESFLEKYKDLFKSDFVLNLDAGMISKEKPTLVYGLRGLAYFEIEVSGPARDLHSGVFGGVVYNPIHALCKLIAGMKNDEGEIQLSDFYNDVITLSEDEKESLIRLGMDEKFYKCQTGVKKLHGERGFTPVERVSARPTLDVNGIIGGYTDEGPKTVIPAKAKAKLSMRLVPDQTPYRVHKQLTDYIEANAPEGVTWEVRMLTSDPACLTDRDFYGVKCFADSIREVWGVDPVYQRGGGSIPIVSHMQKILGLKSVLSGFSLPEDNIHSPNEKLDLSVFEKGVETVIHYIYWISDNCGE